MILNSDVYSMESIAYTNANDKKHPRFYNRFAQRIGHTEHERRGGGGGWMGVGGGGGGLRGKVPSRYILVNVH